MMFRLFLASTLAIFKTGTNILKMSIVVATLRCAKGKQSSAIFLKNIVLDCFAKARNDGVLFIFQKWLKSSFTIVLSIVLSIGSTIAIATTTHNAEAIVKDALQDTSGREVVNHFCVACHAEKPFVSVGAPRMHHEEEWVERKKQGMETLERHVADGFNAMPPRGGCFECSDIQLRQAITYMMNKEA
jgi:cytochrome c5